MNKQNRLYTCLRILDKTIIRRRISTSVVRRNTVAASRLKKTVSRKECLQDRADMLINRAYILVIKGGLLGSVKFRIKHEIQFGAWVGNAHIKARQLVVWQIL